MPVLQQLLALQHTETRNSCWFCSTGTCVLLRLHYPVSTCCNVSIGPNCCDCVMAFAASSASKVPLLRVQHKPRTIAAFASQRDCIAARASIAALAICQVLLLLLRHGLPLLHLQRPKSTNCICCICNIIVGRAWLGVVGCYL